MSAPTITHFARGGLIGLVSAVVADGLAAVALVLLLAACFLLTDSIARAER